MSDFEVLFVDVPCTFCEAAVAVHCDGPYDTHGARIELASLVANHLYDGGLQLRDRAADLHAALGYKPDPTPPPVIPVPQPVAAVVCDICQHGWAEHLTATIEAGDDVVTVLTCVAVLRAALGEQRARKAFGPRSPL